MPLPFTQRLLMFMPFFSQSPHAALSQYFFRFDILPHIAMQSSLQIHCMPLHLLPNYHILQV
jgi:hypothetical protein